MVEQSLKDKTVKGVGWSVIDNLAQHGITFLVGVVLARLLTPEDYGLIGIIAIFTNVCIALINGGFTNALIRKKDVTDKDYNTVFICNLGVSIFLYVVIYFCSPFIAKFFERDELIALTRVASFGIIIGALALVQQTRLTKKIDFKTQTKITLVASVISGCVGITMASIGLGVWSLIAQQLSSHLIRTILLWSYNKWLPKLCFSSDSFHELFGFGWKMMVSRLLDTVWTELYQVVVGKFYSPSTLGQYTRGKNFSQLLSNNLTNVIQRVTFPVLSSIQDDKTRMVSAYRRIIRITMLVTTSGMFVCGAISEPLIYCLIGPQWHESTVYLPLICISSAAYPLHAINLNMLQVQGRSDLFLGLEVVKKILALIPLGVGAFVGIMPMLYVNILYNVIAYFLNSHFSGKLIGYTPWMQIKDFTPSFGIAITISMIVYTLKFLPISYWFILPLQLIVGIVCFICICKSVKNKEYMELKDACIPYIRLKR